MCHISFVVRGGWRGRFCPPSCSCIHRSQQDEPNGHQHCPHQLEEQRSCLTQQVDPCGQVSSLVLVFPSFLPLLSLPFHRIEVLLHRHPLRPRRFSFASLHARLRACLAASTTKRIAFSRFHQHVDGVRDGRDRVFHPFERKAASDRKGRASVSIRWETQAGPPFRRPWTCPVSSGFHPEKGRIHTGRGRLMHLKRTLGRNWECQEQAAIAQNQRKRKGQRTDAFGEEDTPGWTSPNTCHRSIAGVEHGVERTQETFWPGRRTNRAVRRVWRCHVHRDVRGSRQVTSRTVTKTKRKEGAFPTTWRRNANVDALVHGVGSPRAQQANEERPHVAGSHQRRNSTRTVVRKLAPSLGGHRFGGGEDEASSSERQTVIADRCCAQRHPGLGTAASVRGREARARRACSTAGPSKGVVVASSLLQFVPVLDLTCPFRSWLVWTARAASGLET